MECIEVNLSDRSYPIHIGENLLEKSDLFSHLADRQVVIISNETVAPLYAEQMISTLEKAGAKPALFVLKDGEVYKSLESFEQINTFLLEHHYARDVVLLALGGGVIGDLVGFTAACYQRGVDFIQVPTTLLSQVDSSVGGKTAINHPLGKNMIGAFYQPRMVVIDLNVLSTLPRAEFSAGMAEVIKYGIIADHDFFVWIESCVSDLMQLSPAALTHTIKTCCQIKADVVAKDERESGLRALLNLGHTFGHAIEAEMGFGQWLHGQAVSAGMVLAAHVAQHQSRLTTVEVMRITALLKKVELPIKAPASMDYAAFIKHMKRDKKVLAGQLRFVLPTAIGAAEVVSDVSTQILADVIASH